MRKTVSQNFLMVNKILIRELGPCASMLLSLLIDKEAYWSIAIPSFDGWFFKLAEEIEEELGLSDHDRRSCTKKLESMGLIYTKRIGVPSKLHYKIDYDAVEALIVSSKLPLSGPSRDEGEKACNIRSDLNLRPLEVQNLDDKRSKISTSITKTPDTDNPSTQGSLRGGSSREETRATKPSAQDRPTIDQIRRSWERSFLSDSLPAQQDRLPLLRDLMVTLRRYDYTEHDLPRNMADTVTAHWWSKAKDKKQRESLRERSLKDYDLALGDLSDPVEIASAKSMPRNIQKRPKETHEAGSMSLDAFFDLVDQGALEDTDEFYEQMCRLAEQSEREEEAK